jgi:hypothetical protein
MKELTRPGESAKTGSARLIARTRSLYRARIAPLIRNRTARATTGWVAAAALVASAVVFIGSHDAYPTTKIPLESGQAWVGSQQIGSLTLLDGIAAQPVINVPVTRHHGDPLAAGQIGSSGYAIDQSAGRLTRVDGSSLKGEFVDQSLGGGIDPSVVRLYTGVNTLYVVDGSDGLVSTYNASLLRQLGAPARFAAAGSDYTAVVDGQGTLWVLDGSRGALTWFSPTGHGIRARGFTAGAALLTLADQRPVVVDRSAREAYQLNPDGSTRAAVSLGTADGTGIQATGAATQAALLVTTASQGTYKTCTFAAGCDLEQCVTAGGGAPGRCAGAGADALGPAVAADGRVFIPDYSTGGAWIVDPSAAAKPFEIPLLPLRGPFELFEAQGVLFFNDPHSNRAGTLAPDGAVRQIVKYAQAAASPSALPTAGATRPHPSASPSSGGASGSASATATRPRTGRTTASPPPKGGPTRPASSGSPTPSPSPTSSVGSPAAVSCGQILTASVTLRADLHCEGDALTIGANGVTVDLAGHTLSGGGKGTGITLSAAESVAGALIENGAITGFGDGVKVGPNGATSPSLDQVHFTYDGAGGGAAIELGTTTVDGLTLTGVTVNQSDGAGLDAHGVLTNALQITGSTFEGAPVTVDENVDGITVQATITDDHFTKAALTLKYVGSTTVSASYFTDSPVWDMCNAAGGDVFDGNFFDGADIALKIEGMAYESVTANHFTGNGVGLFYLLRQGDIENSAARNTFADEGSAAILVEDSSPAPQEVDLNDNVISGSGRHSSVTDPGGNAVVGGIHIYAPAGGVVVSGNHTTNDAGYGIWALPGTTTGSGNVSTEDADRCSPATLCTYG